MRQQLIINARLDVSVRSSISPTVSNAAKRTSDSGFLVVPYPKIGRAMHENYGLTDTLLAIGQGGAVD